MAASAFSLVRQIRANAHRDGVPLRDMSAAGPLELAMIGANGEKRQANGASSVAWLESEPARARQVTRRQTASRFRFFLDATQRTLPCFHVGPIPIVCGFVCAGILERDEFGHSRLMPGMMVFDEFFVAPERTGRPEVDRALDELRADGARIIDPLENRVSDDESYRNALDDFDGLLSAAFGAVGRRREQIEARLLDDWMTEQHDGLLVVDGQLRRESANAVGVVKSFKHTHLNPVETAALFELKMNQRSPLFELTDSIGPKDSVQVWYQRFWEPTGQDPRYALIRVETSAENPAGGVDDLAGWLMEERMPRATNDARWPVLLYPIHFLEQILKKRLDAATRGWPGV